MLRGTGGVETDREGKEASERRTTEQGSNRGSVLLGKSGRPYRAHLRESHLMDKETQILLVNFLGER